MKKIKKAAAGELRSEYKRSDFGALVRGKYAEKLRSNSNVVILDPEVVQLFPNAAAVRLRAAVPCGDRAARWRRQAPVDIEVPGAYRGIL